MVEIKKDYINKKSKTSGIELTEHEIQNNILQTLSFLKGGFFWRENTGAFVLEHNNKSRFFKAGFKGIADIMGIYKGIGVAIEVKRPKTIKNVSDDQKNFLVKFSDCGGISIVCSNSDKIIETIERLYGEAIKNI